MRVFLPATRDALTVLARSGRLEPPVPGHATTARLVAAWPDEDAEGRDYAALMAAAFDSLALLEGTDLRRRVVVAADVPMSAVDASGADPDDLTAVLVTEAVGLDQVASVHIDADDAAPDVSAAVAALPGARDGDASALEAVALEAHDLLWYARQEIPDLLA